ncbi:uncharacterized protein ACHE_40223S [Aspergillus chevalieri]|uniref:Uncharacterized protein n=1 Tax=Aspergillus chevalieri TaxID=182096 RepID=A0A7R7VN58_ASPCH|nr:uncharacterized protein ACHE_40223S [Aspergillus chevalieri]BCR87659.1 hypothetical protein ACHE_40223S [Aspergillus chevalieri]
MQPLDGSTCWRLESLQTIGRMRKYNLGFREYSPRSPRSYLIDHIIGSFMVPNRREQCIFEEKRICLPQPWLSPIHVADRRLRHIPIDGMAVRSSVVDVNNPEPRMLGHLYDML